MNGKRKQLRMVFVLGGLLLISTILLIGCKKESEPAEPTEPNSTVSAAVEQITCPVMGNAINKEIFTEYKGEKVYFCCAGCKSKFEEEPEKYLAKLPQFKK